MLSRLRRMIDSLVYAGLKPLRGGTSEARPSLAARVDALLERAIGPGRAPADPLYLSSRTALQKARIAALAVAPLLLIGGLVALALSGYFRPAVAPPPEPTRAEAPSPLPAAPVAERDAELLEIRLDRNSGLKVIGTLRNNTNAPLTVEMVIDLADENGSRVTSLRHVVQNAPPGPSQFSFPAAQSPASYALVRSVRPLRSGNSR